MSKVSKDLNTYFLRSKDTSTLKNIEYAMFVNIYERLKKKLINTTPFYGACCWRFE